MDLWMSKWSGEAFEEPVISETPSTPWATKCSPSSMPLTSCTMRRMAWLGAVGWTCSRWTSQEVHGSSWALR